MLGFPRFMSSTLRFIHLITKIAFKLKLKIAIMLLKNISMLAKPA